MRAEIENDMKTLALAKGSNSYLALRLRRYLKECDRKAFKGKDKTVKEEDTSPTLVWKKILSLYTGGTTSNEIPFAQQGFSIRGNTGVASLRSCWKLLLCPTESKTASSKMDLLLAKSEPISNSGHTSVIRFKKGKKLLCRFSHG